MGVVVVVVVVASRWKHDSCMRNMAFLEGSLVGYYVSEHKQFTFDSRTSHLGGHKARESTGIA